MAKLTSVKTASTAALVALFATTMTASATADTTDTTWQKNHPRREQVNNRLANQNARIHNQVKDGNLTKAQAATLHKDDHQIRSEERDMASQNNGHITKQEQRTLNQQQNQVSKQIGPQ